MIKPYTAMSCIMDKYEKYLEGIDSDFEVVNCFKNPQQTKVSMNKLFIYHNIQSIL